jgi:hypothetical protein
MSDSTPLFQPGMHQKLTEACRAAMGAEGYVVRRKGVSEFMEVAYGDIEWTHDPEKATRFARMKDAELAASGNFEAVPFSQALVFGQTTSSNDGIWKVTLTKLDCTNRGGVFVSKARVEELLPKLNERGLLSEYGHPMKFPAMAPDEWWRRALTIEIDHVCCRLSQFVVEQVSGEWCLTATAAASGYFRDAFMAMMHNQPSKIRFGLRSTNTDTYIDEVLHREMRDIITFDFIDGQ